MLESKIKQFYHPRSEDSLQSTQMMNREGFFGSLVVGFAFISRDYYFGTPSDDYFCNVEKIFLTTIMFMTTRDAFTAAINSHRIGLKRYLMNRSSCVLLIFLFWFAKTALISEEIVVLLNKRAAGCFRNLNKYLLKVYQDECITYPLNIFVMDLILKIWDIQGITLKVFERILLTGKEILIIQDKFLA